MTKNKLRTCPLPFSQMLLHPSGQIIPCCWLYDYPLGHIKENTLAEIWHGEAAKTLRQEWIDGELNICKNRVETLRCNQYHEHLDPYVELKADPQNISKLDIMMNGQCNLECIMCDIWTYPSGVYNEETFWKEAKRDIFPNLKFIDAKGGEPFILQDIFRLIDEVSEVNPSCQWQFTTNAHYRFSSGVSKRLDKLEIIDVHISIDSLDPIVFEKIRKKGKLDLVLETIDKWIEYRDSREKERQFPLRTNWVIQKDNWKEVGQFIDFSASKGMEVYLTLMDYPFELSLYDLTKNERSDILKYWKKLYRLGSANLEFKKIIDALELSLTSDIPITRNINHNKD